MIAINILLGLVGLGVVVFVHELGHFLAARLVGIDVEAFSIGWGKPILKKKIGAVEYRLGMFPVGGYCKMRGETDYNVVWEKLNNGEKLEKGTYLGASPKARILVAFAGPLFNFIFAVILLSFVWGFGRDVYTLENRIVLASEADSYQTFPADEAGFRTGDRIIGINGRPITNFHEIHENTVLNANRNLEMLVERNGEILTLDVTPELDRSSGAGRIGIVAWTDPVIDNVRPQTPAYNAGLRSGDTVISANGETIRNSADFRRIMAQSPDNLVIVYERAGLQNEVMFDAEDLAGGLELPWALIQYTTPNLSVPAAIAKGVTEGVRTLAVSIQSLRLLFMGIDLTNAVSGPVRITYMMGDMATQSFGHGFFVGLRSIAQFIALISIALCMMNLLPLPIIDGGMIILFFIEMIRRKPIPPKVISVFQTCGIVIIGFIFVFALFGDILFFIRQ